MKRNFILCTGIALVIATAACNRPDREKYDRIPVPEGLKRDFLFNKGTYWIYAGVHSGTVDSVYIEERGTEWRYDDSRRLVIETFERTAHIVRIVGEPGSNLIKSRNASVSDSQFDGGVAWPLGRLGDNSVSRISIVTIQGSTFQNVGQKIILSDTALIKESIGVLRYTHDKPGTDTNDVYELVRWNIVQ